MLDIFLFIVAVILVIVFLPVIKAYAFLILVALVIYLIVSRHRRL